MGRKFSAYTGSFLCQWAAACRLWTDKTAGKCACAASWWVEQGHRGLSFWNTSTIVHLLSLLSCGNFSLMWAVVLPLCLYWMLRLLLIGQSLGHKMTRFHTRLHECKNSSQKLEWQRPKQGFCCLVACQTFSGNICFKFSILCCCSVAKALG